MLDPHVHYVRQTRTHQLSLRAPIKTRTVCTTGALGPGIVDAVSVFTSQTVARIVSSKVVNALDTTVKTPIITVELHITPADDSGVPVLVLADASTFFLMNTLMLRHSF